MGKGGEVEVRHCMIYADWFLTQLNEWVGDARYGESRLDMAIIPTNEVSQKKTELSLAFGVYVCSSDLTPKRHSRLAS